MADVGHELQELARLHGIQLAYQDGLGRHVEAGEDSLLAVLRALGANLDSADDVPEALRERREELAGRISEPVVVAWDGRAPALELRFGVEEGSLSCRFDLEGGEKWAWDRDLASLPRVAPAPGSSVPGRRLDMPENLPTGYHRLRVEVAGKSATTLVISAPTRAYGGEQGTDAPLWGVFLPLYALQSRNSWGAGDFSDLEALAEWTATLGGGVVATLPMLASFLDEPFEPSPYAPASRLFWNEIYLDPRRVPELETCPEARRLLDSPEFKREVEALRAGATVDYGRLMTLKRRVLEELARSFFEEPAPDRRDAYRAFVASRPELETYAAFRAVGERRGESWQSWPERLREGPLAPADWDEDDRRYHLWVQWITDEQVASLAREARRRGPGLYLDLPLGVHGSSYDVWRYPDLFVQGMSAGAPPDSLFTLGQDWGFPPLHPERLREHGYDYVIESLRHHLRHAGLLRIDHVMQLFRLFWVPRGMGAANGVYLHYNVEEMCAVLSIESHRQKAIVVGENLGTVPPEIGVAMERHGLLGMYVLQYEMQPGYSDLRRPPADTAASLNTHDMPTFKAYWEGRDIEILRGLGFFNDQQAQEERDRRARIRERMADALPPEERADEGRIYAGVLRRCLDHLASSPARMVLVNLEDLWGETEPQNVPGTHLERPNWRRKARLSFEDFSTRPEVVEALRRVDRLRKASRG